MNKIFLSYARRDGKELAEFLHDRLTSCGYDVWMDSHDLGVGSNFPGAISNALEESRTFLIVISPAALQSKWVESEANMAMEAQCHILPVLLPSVDRQDIPLMLRAKNYIPMSGTTDWESLDRLVDALVGGKDIPRVLSFSKQTDTAYEGVLLMGRSAWASATPKTKEEIVEVSRNMWREFLEMGKKIPDLALVVPGYAPLALAFLAYVVGIPNTLPRVYFPEPKPSGGFRVSRHAYIELQQLRDAARSSDET